MWICDCDKNGKFHSDRLKFTETEVNSDSECSRCGYYAKWDKFLVGYGQRKKCKVTYFRKDNGNPNHTTYGDVAEMLNLSVGQLSTRGCFENLFVKNIAYVPKGKGIIVLANHVNKVPKKYEHLLSSYRIYAYDLNGNIKHIAKSSGEMTKLTGDSRVVINVNLRGQSSITAKGFIYKNRDNFDVKNYLKTNTVSKEKDLVDYNWDDVRSYDNSDLGVDYTNDTYGTWKDLLYS